MGGTVRGGWRPTHLNQLSVGSGIAPGPTSTIIVAGQRHCSGRRDSDRWTLDRTVRVHRRRLSRLQWERTRTLGPVLSVMSPRWSASDNERLSAVAEHRVKVTRP